MEAAPLGKPFSTTELDNYVTGAKVRGADYYCGAATNPQGRGSHSHMPNGSLACPLIHRYRKPECARTQRRTLCDE